MEQPKSAIASQGQGQILPPPPRAGFRSRLTLWRCVFLLSVFLLPAISLAQIEWKDPYVTLAKEDQLNSSIARPTRTDYTVVVWEDYRDGNWDIYAQKVDNTTGLALWPDIDGVPVCTVNGNQKNPKAAFDTLGGVIVTWEDFRDAYNNAGMMWNVKIYAHRIILATGELDPVWSPNPDGIPVCGYSGGILGSAFKPRIVGTGEGAYIAWNDFRNATPADLSNVDVYVSYLLSETAAFPGPTSAHQSFWNVDGNQIIPATDGQKNPEIALDNIWYGYGTDIATNLNIDALGAVIVYQDDNNTAPDWNLVATKFDRMGNQYLTQTVDQSSSMQQKHQIFNSGGVPGSVTESVGLVATWEDDRFDPQGNTGVWAAILDPGALTPTAMQVEANQNIDCRNPKLVIWDGVSPYPAKAMIAWEHFDGTGNQLKDVYVNFVDLTTQSLVYQNALPVCAAAADQDQISVDIYYNGYEDRGVIGWVDKRNLEEDIYAQEVRFPSFQFALQTNGVAVTLAKKTQRNLNVNKNVFFWDDFRRKPINGTSDQQNDANIYCQKFGDECDVRNGMEWQDMYAKWNSYSEAKDHRFIVDDSGCTYVVWFAKRLNRQTGLLDSGVFIQKFDIDGVPRWQNDGILLSDPSYVCGKPDVCIGEVGIGSVLVTWQEEYQGTNRIQVVKVDCNGVIVCQMQPTCAGDCTEPRIVEDDSYGAFVVSLEQGPLGSNFRLSKIQMYPCGIENGTFINNSNTDRDVRVVKDRLGGCYVSRIDAAGLKISHFTSALVETPAVAVPADEYDICTDVILNDLNQPTYNALVAYSSGGNIFVQWFKYDITVLPVSFASTTNPVALNSIPGKSSQPSITTDNYVCPDLDGGGILAAWNTEEQQGHKVETQRVRHQGRTQLTVFPAPLELASGCGAQTMPDIEASIGSYRATIVWKDENIQRWCTSPAALIAQHVVYFYQPPIEPRRWYPDGIQLSPVLGRPVKQYNPIVKENHAISTNGTCVSVFWLDDRSGSPGVLGTRVSHWITDPYYFHKDEEETANVSARSISLGQNHPNPFSLSSSGGTEIAYTVSERSHVLLKVYDVLGREVAALVNTAVDPGRHSVRFDLLRNGSPSLSPGIYYYTLTTNNAAATRTMIIVK